MRDLFFVAIVVFRVSFMIRIKSCSMNPCAKRKIKFLGITKTLKLQIIQVGYLQNNNKNDFEPVSFLFSDWTEIFKAKILSFSCTIATLHLNSMLVSVEAKRSMYLNGNFL